VTRQRLAYLGLGLVTVPMGLAVRFVSVGLPWFVMKYGGSTLWAAMIYWVLAFLRPRNTPRSLALTAGAIATLVELSRLYPFPALDAFRHTEPGLLLLGRFFSVRNIVAYWIAIAVAALLDAWMVRRIVQER
jgi:Protein of unknown function (DUF2809)